ncbi:hypothetical protein [Cumulibacter soli]|uniref:hypothetical protein n=1 Tax=Cumulibacter soli TaxID=2546344 RepID=UPI00106842E3|nr:hypothetical protein [Cumulibacter soli]
MVLWICVAIIVVALGVLLVLLVELRAKQRRLTAALGSMQPQVQQANEIVTALQSASAGMKRGTHRAPQTELVAPSHTDSA